MSLTAADVQQVAAFFEALAEAGVEIEEAVVDGGQCVSIGFIGHYIMEAFVGAVGNAATVLEAFDDLGFDLSEDTDPLHGACDVCCFGCIGEHHGVLDWELVGLGIWIKQDDLCYGHRAEPFADVAFVEAGGGGELV